MFDDILKKKIKYDINVIRRDIEIYLGTLQYEIMDTATLNNIMLSVNNYLNGYYGLNTSDIFFDFDKKSVTIEFDKEKLVFSMENGNV